FPSTWPSSDLRRVRCLLPVVDGVVAGVADHEGLALFPGHECRPGGLVWSGFPELRELADLVHEHLGRVAAQFASPFQERGDQFLTGRGSRRGDAVVELCVPVPCKWYPAEPCDQWLLASAFDPGFETGAQPFVVWRLWPCGGPPSWSPWS